MGGIPFGWYVPGVCSNQSELVQVLMTFLSYE